MMITRFRNIAEHALVAKNEPDPLRHARIDPRQLARAHPHRALLGQLSLRAPHVHACAVLELPRVQRLMREKGVLDGMLTAPGYWTVLKAAASSPVDRRETQVASAGA